MWLFFFSCSTPYFIFPETDENSCSQKYSVNCNKGIPYSQLVMPCMEHRGSITMKSIYKLGKEKKEKLSNLMSSETVYTRAGYVNHGLHKDKQTDGEKNKHTKLRALRCSLLQNLHMELRLTTFLKQIFWNISYSFDFPWNQSVKNKRTWMQRTTCKIRCCHAGPKLVMGLHL